MRIVVYFVLALAVLGVRTHGPVPVRSRLPRDLVARVEAWVRR